MNENAAYCRCCPQINTHSHIWDVFCAGRRRRRPSQRRFREHRFERATIVNDVFFMVCGGRNDWRSVGRSLVGAHSRTIACLSHSLFVFFFCGRARCAFMRRSSECGVWVSLSYRIRIKRCRSLLDCDRGMCFVCVLCLLCCVRGCEHICRRRLWSSLSSSSRAKRRGARLIARTLWRGSCVGHAFTGTFVIKKKR